LLKFDIITKKQLKSLFPILEKGLYDAFVENAAIKELTA